MSTATATRNGHHKRNGRRLDPIPDAPPTRTGYSYVRYSTPEQGDGDSVRRQTAAADAWCKRHGVRLDPNKRMEDRGLSGFDGSNIEVGVLGRFLAEVEAGRILEGSVLIVDNLDRFSRKNPWESIPLLCSIVNAGITVVALSPSEVQYERDNPTALLLAVIEATRSNGESKTKSVNLRAAWAANKAAARELRKVITRQIPQWCTIDAEGEIVPIEERAAAVRRLFELAAEGNGVKMICRKLEAEGFKAWGYSGKWSKAYVYLILKTRAALGEYQPHQVIRLSGRRRKQRKAEGEPVAGYYPAIIEESTWNRAQAALAGRNDGGRPKGGRVAAAPDLFAGKLRDAGNDCKMLVMYQTRGPKGRRTKTRVIAPADGNDGRVAMITFPYRIFEAAILAKLKEVTAAEVLGAEPMGESARIAGELAGKEMRLKVLEAELAGDGGEVRALVNSAKKLEGERQVLLRKLAEARGREANPRGEALAEFQTLADVAADSHTRLRLRSLLQNFADSIDVVIVPRRSVRLVAVQVNFAGGEWRNYFIEYHPAAHCRKEKWEVDSFKSKRARLDLRRKADVSEMRRFLEFIHDRLDAGGDRPGL